MEEMNYAQLWQSVKDEVKTEVEYTRLDATEKVSVMLSWVAIIAVLAIFVACAIFCLAWACLHWLTAATGSVAAATAIVVAVLVVLALVFYGYRKVLIINPVTRCITKLFLSRDEE